MNALETTMIVLLGLTVLVAAAVAAIALLGVIFAPFDDEDLDDWHPLD
jgi:hypothetical protein